MPSVAAGTLACDPELETVSLAFELPPERQGERLDERFARYGDLDLTAPTGIDRSVPELPPDPDPVFLGSLPVCMSRR